MSMQLEGPANVDLSISAHRFEERCAESAIEGLSSVVDEFSAVLRCAAPEHADLLSVNIAYEDDLQKDRAIVTETHAQLTPRPSRTIELKKNASTKNVMVSIALRMHETFQLHFRNDDWSSRPVEVRQIVFQMAAVDGTPAVQPAAGRAPSTEQEMERLATLALSILGQVCDGVKFDDVTSVPHLLVEAILRVVGPKTTLKLEQVTLSVVIGDDPLTITQTITSAHLEAALKSGPRSVPLSHAQVELPPHTKLEIEHRHVWLDSKRSKKDVNKRLNHPISAGFQSASAWVRSSPNIEYEVRKRGRNPWESLGAALEALPVSDLFSLEALTRTAIEELPGSKAILMTLNDNNHGSPRTVHLYSDGNIRCIVHLGPLHVGYESFNQGKIAPVHTTISLVGTPTQQHTARICAGEQLKCMQSFLSSRISSHTEGKVFGDDNDLARAIADLVQSAKPHLAKYLVVESLEVDTRMHADCEKPNRNEKTTMGRRKEHVLQTDGSGGPGSDLLATAPVEVSASGDDKGRQDLASPTTITESKRAATLQELVHIGPSSTTAPGETKATTLEDLTRESGLSPLSPSLPTQVTPASPSTSPIDATTPHQRKMERGVVVALGSNVGNRIEEIERACRAIDADPDMRIVDTSFLYETKPMYVEDQERFVNGACEVGGKLQCSLQYIRSTLTVCRLRPHSVRWSCWIDCKPLNKATAASS
jgi:hypothetical protein